MTDSVHGAMTALMAIANGPMTVAVAEIVDTPLHVTRYLPRQGNAPALWHEARAAQATPADTSHMRDTLIVAVMVGVTHGDQDQAPETIERLLDAGRRVYDLELQGRGSLGAHSARRVGIEQPIQVAPNGVPLFAAGLLVRVELHAAVPQL